RGRECLLERAQIVPQYLHTFVSLVILSLPVQRSSLFGGWLRHEHISTRKVCLACHRRIFRIVAIRTECRRTRTRPRVQPGPTIAPLWIIAPSGGQLFRLAHCVNAAAP